MNNRGKKNYKNFNNQIPNQNTSMNNQPNNYQPNNYQYNYYEGYNNNNNNYHDYSAQQKYNDQYNFNQINYYHRDETRNSLDNQTIEEKLRNVTLSTTTKDYIPKIKDKENGEKNKNANDDNYTENNKNFKDYDYTVNDSVQQSLKSQNYKGLDDELIANDESDKEIWIPKYQNCECCEGFVYKCKGIACVSIGSCYCKFTEEMEEFN